MKECKFMKKVLIIGAGPAGLTAAYELLDKSKDFDVTVLEESDVFGGISRTVTSPLDVIKIRFQVIYLLLFCFAYICLSSRDGSGMPCILMKFN